MDIKDKINIIITDDNLAFIEGLKLLLSKNQDFSILDICSNGLELINNKSLHVADLLLVDIEMPEMNGLDAATRINYKYPTLPMIALTMHYDKVYLNDIIMCGFKAFIHKPEVHNKLCEVIELVLSNEFVFPEKLKIIKNKSRADGRRE